MPPPPPPPAPATAGVARQLYAEGLPVSEIARRTGLSRAQVYYWADRLVGADGSVSLAPQPRRGGVARQPAGTPGAGRARSGEPNARKAETGKPGAGKPGAGKSGAGKSGAGKSGAGKSGVNKPGVEKSPAGTAAQDQSRPAKGGGALAAAGSAARSPIAPARRRGSPRTRLLARLWQAAERQVAEIEARIAAAGLDAGAGEPRAAADTEKDARALALLARTLRELSAAEGEGDSLKAKAASAHDTVRDLDVFRRELARRLDRLREGGPGAGSAG